MIKTILKKKTVDDIVVKIINAVKKLTIKLGIAKIMKVSDGNVILSEISATVSGDTSVKKNAKLGTNKTA